jgi:hypothetical protein
VVEWAKEGKSFLIRLRLSEWWLAFQNGGAFSGDPYGNYIGRAGAIEGGTARGER